MTDAAGSEPTKPPAGDENGLKGSDLASAKEAVEHLNRAITALNNIDEDVREEHGDFDDIISKLESIAMDLENVIGE